LTSTDACSSSADSRAQEAINQLFQPVNLTLEQLVRHKLSEGRRVTCRLLGVILEETTPEELQVSKSAAAKKISCFLLTNLI
jgi:hypothetical protein